MTKWFRVAALSIAAVAVAVLAYAVLTPNQTADEDRMGMWNGRATYSSQNVLLIGLSIVGIVGALMVLVLWKEYEPLPPTMMPQQHGDAPSETPRTHHEQADAGDGTTKEDAAARNYLVLRLLTGDERTMFKAIMDSGGEALQKDLILSTKMSNAKVSRVLDRLAAKGVISKERFGATNKIRIRSDR